MKSLPVRARMFVTAIAATLVLGCLAPSAHAQALSISPPSRDFGLVGLNDNKSQSFSIKNNMDRRRTVELSSSGHCASIPADKRSLQIDAGKFVTVQITLITVQVGPCQATITASTIGGSVTAAITAQVNQLTITPNALTFPKINQGQQPLTQSFTLKNEGAQLNCKIGVDPLGNIQGKNFKVSQTNVTLGPGQQLSLNISFGMLNLQGVGGRNPEEKFHVTCGSTSPALTPKINAKGEFNLVKVSTGSGMTFQVSGNQSASIGGEGMVCPPPSIGGGSFGSTTGGEDQGCFGFLSPGAQVTATAKPQPTQQFSKWQGGQGPSAACNNSTAPTCSFSATSDAIGLKASFAPLGS